MSPLFRSRGFRVAFACLVMVGTSGLDCVLPPCGCGSTTLEGARSGMLTTEAKVAYASTPPADLTNPAATNSFSDQLPVSVTFAADGRPDKLVVLVPPVNWSASTPVEVSVLNPGETATVKLQSDEMTMDVTVREADYQPARMRVVLDTTAIWHHLQVQNSSTSEIDGHVVTVQTIEVAPAQDGSGLVWTQAVDGSSESTAVHRLRSNGATVTTHTWSAQRVDATGTLAPQ